MGCGGCDNNCFNLLLILTTNSLFPLSDSWLSISRNNPIFLVYLILAILSMSESSSHPDGNVPPTMTFLFLL